MAKVPLYDGRQVSTAALPNARQNIATPEGAFGATQARQLGQLAQDAGQLAQVFQKQKLEADQTRVDDAVDQLRHVEIDLTYGGDNTTGYTTLVGVDALQRPDNKSLSDDYVEQYNSRMSEIESSLGNDAQRAAFRQKAQARLTSFRGNTANYEGEQFKRYQGSVAAGKVSTASTQIAMFYNDPNQVADGVQSIREGIELLAKTTPMAPSEVEVKVNSAVSQAHLGAIDQALATSNPLIAEDYLRKYKGQLTPGDMLKARGKVDEVANKYIAGAKSTQVFTGYVQAENPSDFDRALNLAGIDKQRAGSAMLHTETRNRHFDKDGKPMTSSAGAVGIAQVMPGTGPEAAKMAGLPWDQNRYENDPQYNEALGRAYLGGLIKKYENLPMAYAAYNGGQGRLDKAIAKAKADGNPSNWLSYMPPETRKYVPDTMRKYSEGGGKPATPSLEQLRDQIRNDPDLQSRPTAMKLALDEVDRKWADHQKGVKANQDNAFAEGMKAIDAGGRYSDIDRSQIDPSKWDDLQKYEERVRGGDDFTNEAVYLKMAGDPARVRAMTDAQFFATRKDLSKEDFKKFANMRADKDNDKSNVGSLDFVTINRVVEARLPTLKLDPKWKTGDGARQGAILKHINDVVLVEQQKKGSKLSDAEIIRLVDEQFLRTRAFTTGGFQRFFGADPVRKVNVFGTKVRDIPQDMLDQIEKDLAAQGFDDPTDQQKLEAYFMGDYLRPTK